MAEKGRKLGNTEVMHQIYTESNAIGIYYHVAVINTSQPMKNDDVITACKVLASRQEALQMRIVPTDPERKTIGFQFKPMDDLNKIDFEAITLETKDVWPECVSRDHDNHKIDYINGPLWRMILGRVERVNIESSTEDEQHMTNQYVLMIKFHHSIADGKSVFDMLYRQFLPVLSAIINGGDAANIVPFVPLSKSVEELLMSKKQRANPVPWYVSIGLNALRWKNRKFGMEEKSLYKFPDEEIPAVGEITKENPCIAIVLDKNITGDIIKSAKRNSVTVQSVLLAADALAFCRAAKTAGVRLPDTFKQVFPIDLRRYVPSGSPHGLGDVNGTGIINNKQATENTPEEFWRSCTKIYQEMKSQIGKEKCAQIIGLLKYFVDNSAKIPIVDLMTETGMGMHLSLSNLGDTSAGPAPPMPKGSFRLRLVEHFYTLTGFWRLDAAPICQYMLTYEGKMTWVVTYAPQRVSRRFVQEYIENLREVLKTYCMGH